MTIKKIEVKSLKVYESMSEETNCFNCDIYINGKKTIYVKNQGQGGDNIYSSFSEIKKEIDNEDYLEEDFCLELFIDKAINEYFAKKDLKSFERKLKREFIIHHDLNECDKSYTYWSLKKAPYDKIKDYVLKNNEKYPNPIFINELPLEQAFKKLH